MNHVSIFEKKWLDLVFEGRNKVYGAYRLRLENPGTTMTAFFFGLLFLSGAAGILALSSFSAKSADVAPAPDNQIHVTKVDVRPPKQPEKATIPMAPQEPKPSQNLPPVVAPKPEADPDPKPETNSGTATTATPGTGTGPETTLPGTAPATENPTADPGPVPTALLDKLPEFPGGMNVFYNYVGRHFEKPEIENMKTARVIVSFVIEKDGTLTDIKVARDPGYGMGKEAIRVLKSLKVTWKPGLLKGNPVRTLYTLPITVNME